MTNQRWFVQINYHDSSQKIAMKIWDRNDNSCQTIEGDPADWIEVAIEVAKRQRMGPINAVYESPEHAARGEVMQPQDKNGD